MYIYHLHIHSSSSLSRGHMLIPIIFSVFCTTIPISPVLADMITTWSMRAASSHDSMDLPMSPLSPLSSPPLASFIHILATGAEQGIDSIDRWTIIANIEAGHIWNDHETLMHVKRFVNDPSTQDSDQNPFTPEYDRHATGVGSLIAGHHSEGNLGVANNMELHSGALATKWDGQAYSSTFSTTPEVISNVYDTFFGFADVINSSWGGPDPTGTSFPALITDGFANQNPHTTFVTSSGNVGPNANTVGGPGSGYNNITVGALHKSEGSTVYDAVAPFSSRGPQDYSDPVNGTIKGVRAEIDIVSPGTHLTMAHYGGITGGNHPELPGNTVTGSPNAYIADINGTSFAAPLVSGTAALIVDAAKSTPELSGNLYARDARVIKSVLLNSADKLPGWNNGQTSHPNGNGGVITNQALDWASGAGALNPGRAREQYISAETRDAPGLNGGTVKKSGWDYGRVGLEKTNIYLINEVLAANSIFSATLSWFRDRTFTPETFISHELGHADLDLIVRDTITKKVIAESNSTYNVVEHLYFTLPANSLYQIEVNYSGDLFGHIKKEEYGLAWFSKSPEEARLAMRCQNRVRTSPMKAGEPIPHPTGCIVGVNHPTRAGTAGVPRGGWLVSR